MRFDCASAPVTHGLGDYSPNKTGASASPICFNMLDVLEFRALYHRLACHRGNFEHFIQLSRFFGMKKEGTFQKSLNGLN